MQNTLGIGLLVNPTAHQLSPLQEDAVQPELGQPLTGALEEDTALMLPL